jgi:hypothetical protein
VSRAIEAQNNAPPKAIRPDEGDMDLGGTRQAKKTEEKHFKHAHVDEVVCVAEELVES